jgi:hypothetical protein
MRRGTGALAIPGDTGSGHSVARRDEGLAMRGARLPAFSLVLLVVATSLACAGERDRKKLEQPLVPVPKLHCYSADCLSLSTTVLGSDACWRTCAAHCGGRFETCVGAPVLNHCRFQGDLCDLTCQKRCRFYGGPLLDITGPLVDFTD